MDVEENEQLEQERLLSLFTVAKGALYLGGFVISQPDKVSSIVKLALVFRIQIYEMCVLL